MGRAYHHYRNYRKPKPNLKLVSDTTDTLQIQWLHDKYGNFIKDKIYEAHARSHYIKNGPYTDFVITDEDGDLYRLSGNRCEKDYKVLDNDAYYLRD